MAGTIRNRGKGRWQVQVYAGRGPDGRERRVARTIRGSERDAGRALAKLVTEVDAGRIRPHDRLTVAELMDRWIAAEEPDWSPSTLATNTQQARDHVTAHIGAIPIDKLRPSDVDQLYAVWRRTLAPSTVDRIASSVLGPALNRAVRWQLIAQSPAHGRDRPRDDPEVVPPTPGQVRALIRAAEPWFACLLRIAASTGARRGSLAALRWRTVDLDEGTARFERALVGRHEKANKGRRAFTASLSTGDVAVLTAHRARMAERALADGRTLGPGSFVWSPDPACAVPYWPSSISRELARTRGKAQVEVHLHGLKHFAVTQMLTAGVPVHVVAQRTGTSPATLQRVYAHWIPAADRHAAEVMDALLG